MRTLNERRDSLLTHGAAEAVCALDSQTESAISRSGSCGAHLSADSFTGVLVVGCVQLEALHSSPFVFELDKKYLLFVVLQGDSTEANIPSTSVLDDSEYWKSKSRSILRCFNLTLVSGTRSICSRAVVNHTFVVEIIFVLFAS